MTSWWIKLHTVRVTHEYHLSLLLKQRNKSKCAELVALHDSAQLLYSLVLVREPQISDIVGEANQGALSVTLQHVTQAGQSECFFLRQCYESWETELPKPFINSHKLQCCCFGLPVATCSTHIQRSLF